MWRGGFYILTIYLVVILQCTTTAEDPVVWKWVCKTSKCVKTRNEPKGDDPPLNLDACKMFCNEFGNLWPKPTLNLQLGNYLSKINLHNIFTHIVNKGQSDDLLAAAGQRFKQMALLTIPKDVTPKTNGKTLNVYLVNKKPNVREFSLLLEEGYELSVAAAGNNSLNATVVGDTFFGLRHGLETLAQLFIYDDIRNHLLLVRDVAIADKPVYPYRGLLLDTARNYYSVESIKRTIDAMASVKLNTFHWHITDTHSFPFVSERRPTLSKLGAYSPTKVYTKKAIQDVVRYALERGVRVLPEFDAPAHVGEGWQDSNLTVCLNAQPWRQYCVEPPCGQLNPVRPELYEYLQDVYTDMAEAFNSDMFHMGGDEVSAACWGTEPEIVEFLRRNRWSAAANVSAAAAPAGPAAPLAGFFKLWNFFQTNAQEKAFQAFGKKLPLILWTSTLTASNHINQFLDKDQYIIQVWTTAKDPEIQGLLKKGYNLIISNYDALYLDCGFGAWVGAGNNWCSPYIGWQKIYDNSPANMALDFKEQILGGEAALWSEQADAASLDARVWPRAAALAERLWAEPDAAWQDAEQRMLNLRERLVRMGIQADTLQPEWCYQNEGNCHRQAPEIIASSEHEEELNKL